MHSNEETSAGGWDFGAVSLFKGVFKKGAELLHQQTVGRAQNALLGCGFELSDQQMDKLASYALKLGQSMLVPIPSKELMVDLDIVGVQREVGGCAVLLDNVSLRGAEVWIYNFANWTGPTAQIAALDIGKFTLFAEGIGVTGSLSLRQLKFQTGVVNVMDVIASVCGESLMLAIGGDQPFESEVGPVVQTFRERLNSTMASTLKGMAKVELGELDVRVDRAEHQGEGTDKGKVKGKLEVRNVKLGVKTEDGEGQTKVTGTLVTELSGTGDRTFDGLRFRAKLRIKAGVNVEGEIAGIEGLRGRIRISGNRQGRQIDVDAQLTVLDLVVKTTTDQDGLVDIALNSCNDAVTIVWQSLTGNSFLSLSDATQLIKDELPGAIKTAVREGFVGSLGASIGAIELVIDRCVLDNLSVEGTVEGHGLHAEVSMQPGESVQVDMGGDIMAHDFLLKIGGEQLLKILEVRVDLDENGTGGASGALVLKGQGLASFLDHKVIGLLVKSSDPIKFNVPVNAYKIMLGGIDIQLPKHKLISSALNKLVLANLRVSDEHHERHVFRKNVTTKTEPRLKVDVLGKRVTTKTKAELGLPEGEPVLIPKNTVQGGSAGAINLQAYVQNILQPQLDDLLR